MIDVATAARLLDFGARMGQGPRALEQLEGAVAVHNILKRHRVAYLADEVGMGKTYVALGAVALFRHFQPDFRLLVIAPRENIQRKWTKELRNFAAHNVRFTDFRNRTIDERPGRPLVVCDNLVHFIHEAVVDPGRDFFARLSSFSLGLSDDNDKAGWRQQRRRLRQVIPWIDKGLLSTRATKEEFKDNFARAVCCALPVFDLVIVDEGHNLKHGFDRRVAARNRVLALAFGHPSEVAGRAGFPHYGPRARRVLFLSATPLEESYRHVWNQLDVLGLGGSFRDLIREDLDDDAKKKVAAQFLVRRVTSITVNGQHRTKNQYRREWRGGGVHMHDDPIAVDDPRQRLVIALVQKKVAELLASEKFNMSFQIGMLASFESFLETTRLKRGDDDGESNFDNAEQTESQEEREGIDVHDVNRLSRHYRTRFNADMPHPKMDALVKSLAESWMHGRKSLVFVRRVASVTDLKRKLDQCYDDWLIPSLRDRLPAATRMRFDEAVRRYQTEKGAAEAARTARAAQTTSEVEQREDLGEVKLEQDDRGGTDTFFAWFFRGEGPKSIVSGANIQRRFIQTGTTFSTFFEDNYVAELLGVPPGGVTEALARTLGLSQDALRAAIREKAVKYFSRAKKVARSDRVEAVQAAAVELLGQSDGPLSERARLIWRERFETSLDKDGATSAPEVTNELELVTFFTEIRKPEWGELRAAIWPHPPVGPFRGEFRHSQLRAQLLATVARLGHALIDMYVLTIGRLNSLEPRTLERDGADSDAESGRAITDYLQLLESQRRTPLSARPWGAFDELNDIAQHFDLILDVNAPDARTTPLAETARLFGSQLRQQQPVAGMSGQINRTVILQFRMPGYPFVLVTTDLLQEGEDLHTFCSSVYHYGISWTPSAMEQRVGRIDRVRSQSDRRLNGLDRSPEGQELLQVFYPYLSDTVEVLQVNRVFERMNTFLKLMHEGLALPVSESRTVDVPRELITGRRVVPAISGTLRTAFPVPEWALSAPASALAVEERVATAAVSRFARLRHSLHLQMPLSWEPETGDGRLLGTVTLASGRVQPFALVLKSDPQGLLVHAISPVGKVDAEAQIGAVVAASARHHGRIGVILTQEDRRYDVTVEGDVGLAAPEHDSTRVALLVKRVVDCADAVERHRFGAKDHQMSEFNADLRKEGTDDHS